MSIAIVLLGTPLFLYCVYLYVVHNDRCLNALPPEASQRSSQRYTAKEIRETQQRVRDNPVNVVEPLPPKTGRRYIIVGGAGFLGGWIVIHLLLRGEDPRRIRVLDIRKPTREDLTSGKARDVDFRIVNISDRRAVHDAFAAPWPDSGDHTNSGDNVPETTILHTAANIRFYERVQSLLHLSTKVNVDGTQNIIDAARAIGASTLVYTSSGSVLIRRARMWLWPWESRPNDDVQLINDDTPVYTKLNQFFSNYAYTKSLGEALVRKADKSPTAPGGLLRTGCLRPGNGVFGSGGDTLCGATLVRRTNPTWNTNIVQNFIYVENCSIAHLCYEARLNEIANAANVPSKTQPIDIGGQAFCIADPCTPPTYGDVYKALALLSNNHATFPVLSPTFMLTLSHIFEHLYLLRLRLISLPRPLSFFALLVPPIAGDLINLQPSLFELIMVHLFFDDSRARLPPEEGGLGYRGRWTTLEGLCKLVDEFQRSTGALLTEDTVVDNVVTAGVKNAEKDMDPEGSAGFGLAKAQRGVAKVAEVADELRDLPEKMPN